MKKNKRIVKAEPEYPKVVETFRQVGDWDLMQMKQEAPSAFNGWVRVERYRVTIEKIEEPIDVICDRLEKLWGECDNHHHYEPLKTKAMQYNYEFKSNFGEHRKAQYRSEP